MNRQKIEAERKQMVVKANALIQRSRYSLTLQQQRLLLFAISKIKPNDDPDTWYEFDLKELCDVCGIDTKTRCVYYDIFWDALNVLLQRHRGIKLDGGHASISWLGDAETFEGNTRVRLRFNYFMAPYLFRLKEFYTQYSLESILAFHSTYSIRLYEVLLSYIYQSKLDRDISQTVEIKLADLREMLDVDAYPKWYDFDRYVLAKAVAEINNYSPDIHISYTTRKTGRSISAVVFTVEQPTPFAALTASRNRRQELDGY